MRQYGLRCCMEAAGLAAAGGKGVVTTGGGAVKVGAAIGTG